MAEHATDGPAALLPDPVTVLIVDGDADYLAAVGPALAARPRLDAVAETDPGVALESLDAVDCVASASDLPDRDGVDLLRDVRERDPALPFVLVEDGASAGVGEVLAAEYTDVARRGRAATDVDRLATRARRLADDRRLRTVASQLRAAVDASRDPVLVVDADDSVAFTNRRLASAISPADEPLRGRPWTDLFTDEAVAHLRAVAIPMGSEGWNWSGRTTLSTRGDEEIDARVDLERLGDGSLVFTFRDLERRARIEG